MEQLTDELLNYVNKNLDQLYHHLIYFRGERYDKLKGQYGFVTASLLEGEDIVLGVLVNGEWITIRENFITDGYNVIKNEIELCDDDDFPEEIKFFKNLLQPMYDKINSHLNRSDVSDSQGS